MYLARTKTAETSAAVMNYVVQVFSGMLEVVTEKRKHYEDIQSQLQHILQFVLVSTFLFDPCWLAGGKKKLFFNFNAHASYLYNYVASVGKSQLQLRRS